MNRLNIATRVLIAVVLFIGLLILAAHHDEPGSVLLKELIVVPIGLLMAAGLEWLIRRANSNAR